MLALPLDTQREIFKYVPEKCQIINKQLRENTKEVFYDFARSKRVTESEFKKYLISKPIIFGIFDIKCREWTGTAIYSRLVRDSYARLSSYIDINVDDISLCTQFFDENTRSYEIEVKLKDIPQYYKLDGSVLDLVSQYKILQLRIKGKLAKERILQEVNNEYKSYLESNEIKVVLSTYLYLLNNALIMNISNVPDQEDFYVQNDGSDRDKIDAIITKCKTWITIMYYEIIDHILKM